MRDLEDEKRIRAYMEAKMTHIKMYNECINLADGLDVAKFAELVRADERKKVKDEFERRIVRQRNNFGKVLLKAATAPPKKEWVGLTDDEREHFRKLGFVGVLAVEDKLKEKNNG